ncbi:hypothetical protein RRG08_016856 [Elysia crispata]|uniref:Uncharacterized protein n=1 Tax=Elysia crispata TaxID=231223 RepID=A0AAE1CIZ9_9GAST|nr:hypothetical protein RRG08_016856 [Elysia crispata]
MQKLLQLPVVLSVLVFCLPIKSTTEENGIVVTGLKKHVKPSNKPGNIDPASLRNVSNIELSHTGAVDLLTARTDTDNNSSCRDLKQRQILGRGGSGASGDKWLIIAGHLSFYKRTSSNRDIILMGNTPSVQSMPCFYLQWVLAAAGLLHQLSSPALTGTEGKKLRGQHSTSTAMTPGETLGSPWKARVYLNYNCHPHREQNRHHFKYQQGEKRSLFAD